MTLIIFVPSCRILMLRIRVFKKEDRFFFAVKNIEKWPLDFGDFRKTYFGIIMLIKVDWNELRREKKVSY